MPTLKPQNHVAFKFHFTFGIYRSTSCAFSSRDANSRFAKSASPEVSRKHPASSCPSPLLRAPCLCSRRFPDARLCLLFAPPLARLPRVASFVPVLTASPPRQTQHQQWLLLRNARRFARCVWCMRKQSCDSGRRRRPSRAFRGIPHQVGARERTYTGTWTGTGTPAYASSLTRFQINRPDRRSPNAHHAVGLPTHVSHPSSSDPTRAAEALGGQRVPRVPGVPQQGVHERDVALVNVRLRRA